MLQVTNLSKRYKGDVQALDNINLNISAGMFGLLGPNGAGKSTLMRTIATLQSPDNGAIRFEGDDVLKDKTSLRKKLGYLPQEFGAYPHTSPLMMLNHFAALKGIQRKERSEQVENLLEKTNLWDVRHKSIDKFSGGMKQRYGIAQALLGSPRLIIVDEPTAGLDPVERRRFQNLLSNISEEVAVILSTHLVDDVAELCPNIAIMGRGRILKTGKSEQLLADLKGKLWSRLVGKSEISSIREKETLLSSRFKAGSIEVRLLSDIAPLNSHSIEPDLEDVYFSELLNHNIEIRVD